MAAFGGLHHIGGDEAQAVNRRLILAVKDHGGHRVLQGGRKKALKVGENGGVTPHLYHKGKLGKKAPFPPLLRRGKGGFFFPENKK
jgi:hypothetical protein